MQHYIPNSPEAMARVVAMMIVTDAHIDDRQIAILDKLDAYGILGLPRNEFMRVSRDYCSDLVSDADEHGVTPLIDPDRADRVIDCVDVPARRLVVARLLMAVLVADGIQRESELIMFGHILDRWSLTRDDVAGTLRVNS